MISPAQCRAARGLLNLSQRQLADEAGLGLRSVQGFETGTRSLQSLAMGAVERVFAEKGISFISDPYWLGVKIKVSCQPS